MKSEAEIKAEYAVAIWWFTFARTWNKIGQVHDWTRQRDFWEGKIRAERAMHIRRGRVAGKKVKSGEE